MWWENSQDGFSQGLGRARFNPYIISIRRFPRWNQQNKGSGMLNLFSEDLCPLLAWSNVFVHVHRSAAPHQRLTQLICELSVFRSMRKEHMLGRIISHVLPSREQLARSSICLDRLCLSRLSAQAWPGRRGIASGKADMNPFLYSISTLDIKHVDEYIGACSAPDVIGNLESHPAIVPTVGHENAVGHGAIPSLRVIATHNALLLSFTACAST
jgi:hypothetical protein